MPPPMKIMYDIFADILHRKQQVMYLYPVPELDIGLVKEAVAVGISKQFEEVIKTQLRAYMVEGKEPPTGISATIKNFADDLAMGRSITVRAGDYIAIQNFCRQHKT